MKSRLNFYILDNISQSKYQRIQQKGFNGWHFKDSKTYEDKEYLKKIDSQRVVYSSIAMAFCTDYEQIQFQYLRKHSHTA